MEFNRKVLKQRREFLEFNYQDMVKRLYLLGVDLSPTSLANWEEGASVPDADLLPKLCEVLKCKMHELFEEDKK